MTRHGGAHPGDERAPVEREIDEELAFHRERTVAELVDGGLSPREAEAEARRRFGPAERHRARLIDIERRRQSGERRRASMEVLRSSAKAVVRGFVRAPGFTLGVVALLTLGLGANAITFGLVDRLVLSGPAAIVDPGEVRRVVVHRRDTTGAAVATMTVGYLDYQDLLKAGQVAAAAAESDSPMLMGSGESAETIQVRLVTPGYFPLLGVTPAAGRFFTTDESEGEGVRVAVLSHAFWRRRFGGDAAALGQVLPIASHRYTVVGVAPRSFTGSAVTKVDVFLPLEAASDEMVSGPWRTSRGFRWMDAIVRLKPGVTAEAAAAELTALHRQGHTDTRDADPEARIQLAPLNAMRGASAPGERGVAALVGAVALFVLIIACANVANLFLARSLRQRETVAVRLALGGGRARLVAEHATQGALFALCGATAAVLVAVLGARPVQVLVFPEVEWVEGAVNLRALLFLAACAVAGGALAAALPMWHAGRVDVVQWLRTGGQRVTRTRTQALLLLVQGALSVLLLVGAGLFVRSLAQAQTLDVGVDTDRVLVVTTVRGDAPRRPDYGTALRASLAKVPAVERTTLAAGTVPFSSSWAVRLNVRGLADRPRIDDGGPYIHYVEPGYFETVGTRIVEGRSFTPGDREGAPRVAVVNSTMARLYWPGESALGKCLLIGPDDPPCSTVVGVAANTRRRNLVEGESVLYYVPLEQGPPAMRGIAMVLVRAADGGDETLARLAETIRRESRRLDPGLRYVSARTLTDVISPQLRSWRLGAGLFSVFGALALLVAGVGLYSVVAFGVEGRRREIGVRAALGASAPAILRLVIGDGLRLAAAGVAVGLLLAWALMPLMAGLLFAGSPQDPAVFAVAAAILVAAALLASAVPGFRAARIEPARALRDE